MLDIVREESGRSLDRALKIVLAGSALIPASALAQAPVPANLPPAALAEKVAPEDKSAGDIIVTARKRAETVQDVPATVGVVTAQAIANTGASNLQQLQAVAPGLNLGKAPTGNEIGVTLRGLGSAPGVPSFDSSVSLFVDGVYAPRSREFAASMFDVQRIEVIRGTQAALLGKNTSLGAINLITRRPGERLAADLRVSYETERGSRLATGGIDLPLSDTLHARVSGQMSDDKGFVYNTVLGRYSPRIHDRAIRGVLMWKPIAGIDITGIVQHDVARNYGSPVEIVASTGLPQVLAALAGYPGVIDTNLDRRNQATGPGAGQEQSERLLIDKYNLTASYAMGDNMLTSITAYRGIAIPTGPTAMASPAIM